MANIKLGPANRLSGWRKVSLGSWRPTGDSTIYAETELDVEDVLAALRGTRVKFTHFAAKALAQALKEVPELNVVVRFGRVYPRLDADVFFHVLSDRARGDDLSGLVIRSADQLSLESIAADFESQVERIRSGGDPEHRRVKSLFKWLPGWLRRPALDVVGWLLVTLNIPGPWIGSARDNFGSVMVTNTGGLGIDFLLGPIAPYTGIPMVVSIGKIRPRAVAVGHEIRVRRTLRMGFSVDHRVADGYHLGRFIASIERQCQEQGSSRAKLRAK